MTEKSVHEKDAQKVKEALKKLENYRYLCGICNSPLVVTTGGFWCPLHGIMEPDLIKIEQIGGIQT
jgi:hypothetical protein